MSSDHRVWVMALAVCGAGLFVTTGRCVDIRQARGPVATVQLVDVSTGEPARNATGRLNRDNGIRCLRAPCPTNTKSWKATSDPQGFVRIPTGFLQSATQIENESLSGDLIEDSEAVGDDIWI